MGSVELAPSFKLNTGASIPAIGLGVGNITNAPDSVVRAAVLHAIKVGYRHFDTASMYGTECVLGDALSEALNSGMVNRKELFITSKLWCDSLDPLDVIPALQETLANLKLGYLDLYLIHIPMKLKKGITYPLKGDVFLPFDLEATWSTLELCYERGLAKAIGVSNFSGRLLAELLNHAKIPPAVNQVEVNPLWQQQKLRNFCDGVGIHISAWSPLHAPDTYYGTNEVLTNPIIKSIATKHNKTPAQVALRWSFQLGVSVLPKSFTLSRITGNFDIFDWELSAEDMSSLANIEQKSIGLLEADFIANNTSYKNYRHFFSED